MATVTIEEFVKDLTKLGGQLQAEIGQKLLNGGAATLEEYRHQTGIAKGIGKMSDMAYQLMKNRELADDDLGLGDMPPDPPNKKKTAGRRPKP